MMEALGLAASVITILHVLHKTLGLINDVKGAPKDHARCAIELSNLHNLLLHLRYRLEEGDIDASWYSAFRALTTENGPFDQFKEDLELLQGNLTNTGSLSDKFAKGLVWKYKKVEVDRMLERIARLKILISVALQMDHFKLSQAIKEDSGSIRDAVGDLTAGVNTLLLDSKYNEILAWLSSTNYPAQFADLIHRRQAGTGNWFLTSSPFLEWRANPSSTLLCTGMPGVGKTIIATSVIDSLIQSYHQNTTVGIAFVYCSYKAQAHQTVANLLTAILKQLVQSSPQLVDSVQILYDKHISKDTKPMEDEVMTALKAAVGILSTVYVVVDALDELSNKDCTSHVRTRLMHQLRALQAKGDVRLLVTTRKIPDIVEEIFDDQTPSLELFADTEDVKKFIVGQFDRLPRCIQRDPYLQDQIQESIVQAIDGMFLLARLYVDSLLDKRTKSKVQCALDNLATGSTRLDDAYADALKRVESQLPEDLNLAKKTITWLTLAQRALTTAELRHALALEAGDLDLDKGNLLDMDDIVSVCAGLVAVDDETDVVRLVHYTTQKYFEKVLASWNPTGQELIARTCLTYLSFGIFQAGACSDKDLATRFEDMALLSYASSYWGAHAATVQREVSELACNFLSHDGAVSTLIQAVRSSQPSYKKSIHRGSTGLHLAVLSGLLDLSKALLEKQSVHVKDYANQKDSEGYSPLYFAALQGHQLIVELLLASGGEIKAEGQWEFRSRQSRSIEDYISLRQFLYEHEIYINTPFENCTQTPDQAVAIATKELLERGVDISAGCTPLHAASKYGYSEVVKLLLEAGADVTVMDYSGCTALHLASLRGHAKVISILLEKNAACLMDSQTSKKGNTALHLACANHQIEAADTLLSFGADWTLANVCDNITAVFKAVRLNDVAMVKLFLDRGVDVESVDSIGGTILFDAANNGHYEMVDMLLDRGANINSRDINGHCALYVASYRGYFELVKLLIRKSADLNMTDDLGFTSLGAAASQGHSAVATILLEGGADPTLASKTGLTPLHACSRIGSLETMKVLLQMGTNANSEDSVHWTPLFHAVRGAKVDAVKLLLTAQACLDHRDKLGWTLLHVAAADANLNIIQYLTTGTNSLDTGISNVTKSTPSFDLNVTDNTGWTPLSHATMRGHTKEAMLFLEQGAKADIMDFHGRTLFHIAAASSGRDSVLRLVADLKIDPNTKDAKGDSLLAYAALSGSVEILEEVMKLETQENCVAGQWTILHWGCKSGNLQVVIYLVERGFQGGCVQIDHPKGEWTPLSILAFFHSVEDADKLSAYENVLGSITAIDQTYAAGKYHNDRVCDGCFDEKVRGPLFHCRTCPDLDYCFMCRYSFEHLHEKHGWEIWEPKMI